MAVPDWFAGAHQIAEIRKRQNPDGRYPMTPARLTMFYLTVSCAQTGQLASLIQSFYRADQMDFDDIIAGIADIRIATEHLAHNLGFDLDEVCTNRVSRVAEQLKSEGP